MDAMDDTRPHWIGKGRLAIPQAESDSQRYGTVMLLDEHSTPARVREFTAIGTAVFTATITNPVARELGIEAGPQLLGIGALFFDRITLDGRAALAAGVRPRDGRLTGWLDPRTLAGLDGVPVLLEAHESWPGCRCKPAFFKPRRKKRGPRRSRGSRR